MNYFLNERMEKIREFINFTSPRKREVLLQNNTMWDMLCSCMDIIEDLEYALESYLTEDPENADTGRKYLLIFGALQALYVQQDAIKNLHKALDIPYTMDISIEEIRAIRNDAAGHPTNRRNKEFVFINRSFLDIHKFQLMKLDPTKSNNGSLSSEHVDINVTDLIATQRSIFIEVLDNVIETLKEEEVAHRNKFAGKRLSGVFSSTTYLFEKIWDAVLRPNSGHASSVDHYADQISKSIKAFRDGLKERGEPDDSISEIYETLEYALKHIKAYFTNNKTHIQRKDTPIFVSFINQQVDVLRKFAQDIDDTYSQ